MVRCHAKGMMSSHERVSPNQSLSFWVAAAKILGNDRCMYSRPGRDANNPMPTEVFMMSLSGAYTTCWSSSMNWTAMVAAILLVESMPSQAERSARA